jgi:hypothetical protein
VISTYRCTAGGCGGRLTLDSERRTQQASYPRDQGPLSDQYRPHDCPVARGLWPPEIDRHPNARKVR